MILIFPLNVKIAIVIILVAMVLMTYVVVEDMIRGLIWGNRNARIFYISILMFVLAAIVLIYPLIHLGEEETEIELFTEDKDVIVFP